MDGMKLVKGIRNKTCNCRISI